MSEQNTSNKAWYLIYTKPRHENVAKENLHRQGYSTYLPLIETTHRRSGRYMTAIAPIFPRYLFIHLNTTTDNWSPIRSTLGVTQMVRFGGLPAKIPDELIMGLQSNENVHGLQEVSNRELCIGDPVRIIDGMLSGYEGVFDGVHSKDRVMVLLKIAERYTRIELSAHHLQSV